MRQWELANKAGIDGSKLSLIESGRLLPSPEVKEAISKAMNKPASALFPTNSFEPDRKTEKRREHAKI
jgi:transcriptional regulator with XRE-family HTH domain